MTLPLDDVFRGRGVRVTLPHRDNFLKICETLTRMGVANHHTKTLYQSCHLLHKRGQYAVCHYKELFLLLDGKIQGTSIVDDDYARRNRIVHLLAEWSLCSIVDPSALVGSSPTSRIHILPYHEKAQWTLISKYTLGKKPENRHED